MISLFLGRGPVPLFKSTMKKILIPSLACAPLLLPAAVISVNFEGLDNPNGGTDYPNLLVPGDVAGVVPASNWNNVSGAAGTGSTLVNDSGAASGATLDWTGQATWSWERSGDPVPANADGSMFNGYLDTTGNDGNHTFTVANVPFALYDVIVYVDGEFNLTPGRPLRANINPGGSGDNPATDVWVSDTLNWNGTYTQGTGTDLASATEGANYVRFSGITQDNFGIFVEAETFRAAINGFQIVEVPEPGTGLLALLGLGLAARRRR